MRPELRAAQAPERPLERRSDPFDSRIEMLTRENSGRLIADAHRSQDFTPTAIDPVSPRTDDLMAGDQRLLSLQHGSGDCISFSHYVDSPIHIREWQHVDDAIDVVLGRER